MSNRTRFDAVGFYKALDGVRHSKGLSWKTIADEAKISASTLTRMAQGKRPDVDSLASLLAWSKLDVDNFVNHSENDTTPSDVEPLAMISTYLRTDKNLSDRAATVLDEIIKTAYVQLRESNIHGQTSEGI